MTMASGVYGNLITEAFTNALAYSLNADDTIKWQPVTDTYTPDFDTHGFYADLTHVVSDNPDWPTAGAICPP